MMMLRQSCKFCPSVKGDCSPRGNEPRGVHTNVLIVRAMSEHFKYCEQQTELGDNENVNVFEM